MKIKDKIEIIERNLLTDTRGYFMKVLTGTENGLPKHTGEIYITMAVPNESRGGHYHIKAKEWFTIIKGEALLAIEDVTSNERLDLKLSANTPVTVVIPPLVAHIFHNFSTEEFVLLAYSDTLYNSEDTILFDITNKLK